MTPEYGNQVYKHLTNDKGFISSVCRLFNLSDVQVREQLKKFIRFQVTAGKRWETATEAKQHFLRWQNVQPAAELLEPIKSREQLQSALNDIAKNTILCEQLKERFFLSDKDIKISLSDFAKEQVNTKGYTIEPGKFWKSTLDFRNHYRQYLRTWQQRKVLGYVTTDSRQQMPYTPERLPMLFERKRKAP